MPNASPPRATSTASTWPPARPDADIHRLRSRVGARDRAGWRGSEREKSRRRFPASSLGHGTGAPPPGNPPHAGGRRHRRAGLSSRVRRTPHDRDSTLCTGRRVRLGRAYALLAEKEGRPLGMVCESWPDLATPLLDCSSRDWLTEEFGGLEGMALPPTKLQTTLGRVACVGAMDDKLVRVSARGGRGRLCHRAMAGACPRRPCAKRASV